uniref:Lysosomal acid phosphatase n=1 Tax=Steinernema glaseri TaxID=37863 RepID=A0A1I7YGE6_9BILA
MSSLPLWCLLLIVPVVWRHGDRAPTKTYPNDVHQEDAWPNGWGELTQVARHAAALRIGKNAQKAVHVHSTDYNRTLVSAMSNLAGMYPMGVPGTDHPNGTAWPSNWTPIPVHTDNFKTDFIGNMWSECARKTELDEFIESSSEYKRVVEENKEFFDFLTNKTGMHIDLYEMYDLYDVNFIETKYNLSQPDWLTADVAKKLWNLTHTKNEFNYGISKPYVPELIKLRGGPLLKDMNERMMAKVRCLQKPEKDCDWIRPLKYYAYSAHDTTIAGFLATLGDEEEVIGGIALPQYTAAISVELWNLTSVGPAVKILFHPGYNKEFHTITALTKGCPSQQDHCPLNTFYERSKIFMPKDMREDCKRRNGRVMRKWENSTKRRLSQRLH